MLYTIAISYVGIINRLKKMEENIHSSIITRRTYMQERILHVCTPRSVLVIPPKNHVGHGHRWMGDRAWKVFFVLIFNIQIIIRYLNT